MHPVAAFFNQTKSLPAMIEAGINHAETAKAKASYTVSVSHGLDTKTLKKDLPELWEEYPKETRREFVTVKAI